MHLIQVPQFMLTCYKAKRVPFFWGPRGVGKSDGVAQGARFIAEQLGVKTEDFGFIDLRLGTQEVGDLVGIPRVREISPGEFRTVWSKPEWFPNEGTKGIIFLDEFNRAGTNDVIQAMFQFVLGSKDENGIVQRALHTHKLPEGWMVVCAGNPDTSDYVVQAIDTAMLDRFIQIKIDVEKKVSVKWMKNNLKNPEIWKFVQSNRDSLGKPEKFQMTVTASPRSYEFIDDMLAVMDEADFNNFGLEVLNGIIGESLAMLLYKELKDSLLKPLTADEILKCTDWDKFVEDKLKKYITKAKAHLELIDVTLTDLEGYIEKNKPTDDEAENIMNFLTLIPPDMALKFIKSCVPYKENFVPVILTQMDHKRDDFTMKMIQGMGYEDGVIEANIAKLDEISAEYEKQTGIEKK